MSSRDGHVQLRDFSDREILSIMLDLGGEVATPFLAARIYGWSEQQKDDKDVVLHGTRCVTSRLSWMRRFGLVVKGEEKGTWGISREGEMLRTTKLGRSFSSAISNSPEWSMLELAHQVGEQMLGRYSRASGTAMRRELQHQIQRGRMRR